MKKRFLIINILTFLILSLCGCGNSNVQPNNTDANNNDSTKINRASLTIELPEEQSNPVETELGSFSTTIKSKGPGRLNNIRITCSKINGQTVEPGSEFSFEQIVGKSSPEEGYQKADIFVNKKVVQAYGGGNCQVSTTLYNAVLAVQGLTVTERHPHGRRVTYVPEGKDAAVSHGSLDFKFKNNIENKIKIYASSDDSILTVKIVKLN